MRAVNSHRGEENNILKNHVEVEIVPNYNLPRFRANDLNSNL